MRGAAYSQLETRKCSEMGMGLFRKIAFSTERVPSGSDEEVSGNYSYYLLNSVIRPSTSVKPMN
jgi:hypothetical protein